MFFILKKSPPPFVKGIEFRALSMVNMRSVFSYTFSPELNILTFSLENTCDIKILSGSFSSKLLKSTC